METLEEKNIYKKYRLVIIAFFIIFFIVAIYYNKNYNFFRRTEFYFPNSSVNGGMMLEESGKTMKDSKNPDWWLNSGGIMNISANDFSTNLGKLPENSKWRKLYNKNNSRDTDQGYYPQNIFRLVSKSQWQNFSQEVYFNIEKINLSESEYRNESNGVLLFNRYQDGDNLYYTGVRVDGDAVIKKKIKDKYYTLKEGRLFTNNQKYDRVKSPNFLPLNSWVGIKSEVENGIGNAVNIKLYVDRSGKGEWELVLEAKDKGDKYGKAPFLKEGYVGIRTDFMDVKFRDYKIIEQ
ncbi:MAG TPA: hypothetical protein P5232_00210 [Candidatus Moranbacteria bacterium]|nr:hypothetical protein [Candidatus Moranbacteria bacterium]